MRLGSKTARGEMLGSPDLAPGSSSPWPGRAAQAPLLLCMLLHPVNKSCCTGTPASSVKRRCGWGALWEEVLALSTTRSLETFLSPSWGPWLSCLCPASPGSSVFSTKPPFFPSPKSCLGSCPVLGVPCPAQHPSVMLDSLPLEVQSGTSPSPQGECPQGPSAGQQSPAWGSPDCHLHRGGGSPCDLEAAPPAWVGRWRKCSLSRVGRQRAGGLLWGSPAGQ